jgi:hypothetical protein
MGKIKKYSRENIHIKITDFELRNVSFYGCDAGFYFEIRDNETDVLLDSDYEIVDNAFMGVDDSEEIYCFLEEKGIDFSEEYDDEYDDDYYDDDDRDDRDSRDRGDRNGRRDRKSDAAEYDDEDFRRPMRKQRDAKKNSVQLDDFRYGGDKDPEKIAKRHGQQHRPAQNRQQPRKRDEAEFSKKHDLDSAYLEEASKIADKTKEVPKQAPKTRPAPHNKPAHRPAPAPQKSTGTATSNSIEDLMKMM